MRSCPWGHMWAVSCQQKFQSNWKWRVTHIVTNGHSSPTLPWASLCELLLSGEMLKEPDASVGEKGSLQQQPALSWMGWVDSPVGERGLQFLWRSTAALPRLPAGVPGSANCYADIHSLDFDLELPSSSTRWARKHCFWSLLCLPQPRFGLDQKCNLCRSIPISGRFLQGNFWIWLTFYWK